MAGAFTTTSCRKAKTWDFPEDRIFRIKIASPSLAARNAGAMNPPSWRTLSAPCHLGPALGAFDLKAGGPSLMGSFFPTIWTDTVATRPQPSASSHALASTGWALLTSSASPRSSSSRCHFSRPPVLLWLDSPHTPPICANQGPGHSEERHLQNPDALRRQRFTPLSPPEGRRTAVKCWIFSVVADILSCD
jgi:hypothetical protein